MAAHSRRERGGRASPYLAIAGTIVAVLSQGGRLRTHTLGQAALLAFGTCGDPVLPDRGAAAGPSLGIDSSHGEALRDAWPTLLGVWAVIGGAAALFLLSQRGSYGDVLLGPGLMDEVKARERQAFEINDNLVQGLSVAKYSFEMGQEDRGRRAVNESLRKAREMTTDLLGEPGAPDDQVVPGELRREQTRDHRERGGWKSLRAADTISVFLVDDVPELRELIRYGLEGDEDFAVVGEAGDGAAAIEGIAETAPPPSCSTSRCPAWTASRRSPRSAAAAPTSRSSSSRASRPPAWSERRASAAPTATSRRARRWRTCARWSAKRSSGTRQEGQQGRLNGDEPPRRLVGKRGTQDSNLESPTLEAGALASLASAPRGPNRSRATQGRGYNPPLAGEV